jgi:hypothetical protein
MTDPHALGWETIGMIDGLRIRPGWLKDTELGSIFVPATAEPTDERHPFIAGSVNGTRVFVCLGGERSFRFAQPHDWNQRAGYFIDGVRFEVDRGTATYRHREDEVHLGEIVRLSGALTICACENERQYLADIAGSSGLEDGPPLIAFSRWEIVTELAGDRHVLYHHTGRTLLFGPYNPPIDEDE